MARLTLIWSAYQKSKTVHTGETIADTLANLGVYIDLPCGGAGICGGCRIQVCGALSPPTPRELQNLSQEALNVGWRLACQARIEGDLEIVLPPDQNETTGGETPGIQSTNDLLGLAVDLGTTTLAGRVVNLTNRQVLAEVTILNPQVAVGADLITRIQRALDPGGRDTLRNLVTDGINRLIKLLADRLGITSGQIGRLTVAGNSVMHHLLLGLDLEGLSAYPFEPSSTAALTVPAGGLGIKAAENATVYLFPLIGGFVGGDAVAGIMSTGIQDKPGARLLIDLGTNGEAVLFNEGRAWATSTAAGPAFEGGEISWGMRADPGAVIDLDINDGWRLKTIDNAPSRGIAGSGLIRIVVELLSAGLLLPDGRLKTQQELDEWERVLVGERLRQGPQGIEILLDTNGQITMTQRDIRQLQLAKGAIRSAVEALLDEAGIKAPSLAQVYVAGAFGSHVDAESLLRIGLLPEIPAAKITAVGNSSLDGAVMALFSQEVRAEAERLAGRVKHVPLETRENYQEMFVEALRFPG